MYKNIFDKINKDYIEFYEAYKRFYMERFIYSNTEIEGIKTKEERTIFVDLMLQAFNEIFTSNNLLDVGIIKSVGNIVNYEKGIEGFRKINIYPGNYTTFLPSMPYQIYSHIYSLLDNYYNVWTDLDPFLREAMFHINFMRIHPFEDGNKRSAKIILASNLLKSSCAPIIITEEDTEEYYSFINNLDYDGFAEFLKQRSKIEFDTLVSLFKMIYSVPMDESPELFIDITRKRAID